MKNIIFALILLGACSTCFAQKKPIVTAGDHLIAARKNQTAAIIVPLTGGLLGGIIYSAGVQGDYMEIKGFGGVIVLSSLVTGIVCIGYGIYHIGEAGEVLNKSQGRRLKIDFGATSARVAFSF